MFVRTQIMIMVSMMTMRYHIQYLAVIVQARCYTTCTYSSVHREDQKHGFGEEAWPDGTRPALILRL